MDKAQDCNGDEHADGPDSKKEALGPRIQRLMEAKGWSQTTLSDKSGVERSQLNRYINGHRHPSPEDIGSIAQALGVTAEELLDGAELPDSVRKAIDHAVSLTERALRAERERDEAQAMKAAAEEALVQRTDANLKTEKTLRATVAEKDTQLADERRAREAEKAEAARVLTALNQQLASLRAQLNASTLRALALEGQIAQERSAKQFARGLAIVTGLGGLALGAAASSSSPDED